jgi:cell division septal protein FtsQ
VKLRPAALLGGLLVVAASGLGAPALLRKLSLFRVRRIELQGLNYLAGDDVVRAMGLAATASIFDPRAPLERKALLVPGVLRARVGWRLPGTLEVEITERVPVALTPEKGRLALVDRRGRILPFDPSRGAPDLPIAVPDTAVLGVLERLRDGDPSLYGEVVGARRERATVVLETATRRLLLRIGASAREIQALSLVLAEAARRKILGGEFDARFEGRVIVRGVRGT